MRFVAIQMILLAVVCGSGCDRSSLPSGSFGIAVTDTFVHESQRVWRLDIKSSEASGYSLLSSNIAGRSSSWTAIPKTRNGVSRASIWITASRIPVPGKTNDVVHTLIDNQMVVRKAVRGRPLSDTVSLTIQDGTYRLDEPVALGRLDGGDLILTVGETADVMAEGGGQPDGPANRLAPVR